MICKLWFHFYAVLACINVYAMALHDLPNEHKLVSGGNFMTEKDAIEIEAIAQKMAAENGDTTFLYPKKAPTHKVVFYLDENQINLRIFSIDHSVFDRGSQTEIKIAEQILPTRDPSWFTTEKVAVKIIKKKADSAALADFFNEEGILRFINRFKGSYEDEDHYYLFNDFVLGENLESLLLRNMDSETKEKIALAVITAVHELHQNNFIFHNDIKSGNIKIVEVDGKFYANLVDFGQSRRMNDPQFETLGSSGYRDYHRCGPNRLLCSIQSDYFALGVLLFEILADINRNYQLFILSHKQQSPFEWDLATYTDFLKAFPDSFGDINLDTSVTRAKIVALAKLLTGSAHHQVLPAYLTAWLAKFNIVIKSNLVTAEYLAKKSEECMHHSKLLKSRSREKLAHVKINSPRAINQNLAESEKQTPSRASSQHKGLTASFSKTIESFSSSRGTSEANSPRNDDNLKKSKMSSPRLKRKKPKI